MLSIIVNSSDSSRGSRPDRGAQNRASDQEEYMRNRLGKFLKFYLSMKEVFLTEWS